MKKKSIDPTPENRDPLPTDERGKEKLRQRERKLIEEGKSKPPVKKKTCEQKSA